MNLNLADPLDRTMSLAQCYLYTVQKVFGIFPTQVGYMDGWECVYDYMEEASHRTIDMCRHLSAKDYVNHFPGESAYKTLEAAFVLAEPKLRDAGWDGGVPFAAYNLIDGELYNEQFRRRTIFATNKPKALRTMAIANKSRGYNELFDKINTSILLDMDTELSKLKKCWAAAKRMEMREALAAADKQRAGSRGRKKKDDSGRMRAAYIAMLFKDKSLVERPDDAAKSLGVSSKTIRRLNATLKNNALSRNSEHN